MSGTISATTAALIAAAVGAAGTGAGIFESVKSGDEQQAALAANQKAILDQQQAQANQANLTKQEAVLGAQGQEQAQTDGSLTDSGTAALTDLLAGYPGYQAGSSGSSPGTIPGGGISPSGTGTPATSPGSTSSGTPDIAAILAALRNGGSGFGGPGGSNISGGNWPNQPQQQPQSFQQLANPVI